MSSSPLRRRPKLWQLLFVPLLACSGAVSTPTEVLVVVDSDLSIEPTGQVGEQLTELRVRTFDMTGSRELDDRTVALGDPSATDVDRFGLPFSFSIVPNSQDSTSTFRLVVTGRGPGENGETADLVEQQAWVTFRPGVLQEVRIFLGRLCLAQLCRSDEVLAAQTCDPGSGSCAEIPTLGRPLGSQPDAATPDTGIPDATLGEAGRPDARSDSGDGEGGSRAPDGGSNGMLDGAPEAAAEEMPDGSSMLVDAQIDEQPPTEVVPAAEACVGSSGKTLCTDARLIECDAAGQVAAEETCESPRHCQAGLSQGTCAPCLEEEHRCQEATLERCNAELEWEVVETCATAELCNAKAKACTDAACVAASKTCEGDMLQACNASQTGFEAVKTCEPGLCDEIAGECDVCVPGVRACEPDGTSVRTCRADGQGSDVAVCESARSKCTGDGVCVQCTEAGDCMAPSNPCLAPSCDTGNGTCGSVARPSHTKCTGGVCDGAGKCTGCLDKSDCSGSLSQCKEGACVACTADEHCGESAPTCMKPSCQSDGSCGFAPEDAHAECSGGVCDGEGKCTGCIDKSDCGGLECSGGSCVQCITDIQCQQKGGSAPACMKHSCGANGSCGFAPQDAHTRCDGGEGVCDGDGTCIGCVDATDCSGATPYCSGGACVECTANSHCDTSKHEACQENECVVQPYCGDGRVNGSEACDPKATGWSPYTCSETCVKQNLYNECGWHDDCNDGVSCVLSYCSGFASGGCRMTADCPVPPAHSGVERTCLGQFCLLLCDSDADCPPGVPCRDVQSNTKACWGCQQDADCGSGKTCRKRLDDAGNPSTTGLCR